MRTGWVWPLVLLLSIPTGAAPTRSILEASLAPQLRASLTRDYEIELIVRPHAGDAWTRLARRVCGDASKWREIAGHNGIGENLTPEQNVRVPLRLLRPELQRDVMARLFRDDRPSGTGWHHKVSAAGMEGEPLWKIAEWFTGEGSNYSEIRKANPGLGLSTRLGDVIFIPEELLAPAFRAVDEVEGENASSATAQVRNPAPDQVQRSSEDEDAAEAPVVEAVASGPAPLTYGADESGAYAVYRLQKGEALYSSVAIRFTGRVYAKDVGEVIGRLVAYNDIADVSKIHAGAPIRIPMDLLLPEYRPDGDPARVAAEESKRASARAARRAHARNLAGVTIILDPGHGGRDVGTIHGDVPESTYVYDVTARLKKILETRSGARVAMTTKSKSQEYRIPERDELAPMKDHVVLTSPRYTLDDPVVGVNLRWYLANSIFSKAVRAGTPKEKVVFISIHADSLHPSLRGAMAYIPGEQYVRGSYRKTASVYLARAEVRERPVVIHSERQSLEAEGLSRGLAESVIREIGLSGLKVHPFNPVRDNVVRNGREWVPAIIRHNLVPTRALIEICNLGNKSDRNLIRSRLWRQQVAEAIYRGIAAFYAGQGEEREAEKVAARELRIEN